MGERGQGLGTEGQGGGYREGAGKGPGLRVWLALTPSLGAAAFGPGPSWLVYSEHGARCPQATCRPGSLVVPPSLPWPVGTPRSCPEEAPRGALICEVRHRAAQHRWPYSEVGRAAGVWALADPTACPPSALCRAPLSWPQFPLCKMVLPQGPVSSETQAAWRHTPTL